MMPHGSWSPPGSQGKGEKRGSHSPTTHRHQQYTGPIKVLGTTGNSTGSPNPTELPGTERWVACTAPLIQALLDCTALSFPANSDESPAKHRGPLCQGPPEPIHQALLQPPLQSLHLSNVASPALGWPLWNSSGPVHHPWLQTRTQRPGTSIQSQGHPQAKAFH